MCSLFFFFGFKLHTCRLVFHVSLFLMIELVSHVSLFLMIDRMFVARVARAGGHHCQRIGHILGSPSD
jgi:hypothetical protein